MSFFSGGAGFEHLLVTVAVGGATLCAVAKFLMHEWKDVKKTWESVRNGKR